MSRNANTENTTLKKEGVCCLCGGRFTLYGNNPWPLADASKRCCNRCNREKVIPARIRLASH